MVGGGTGAEKGVLVGMVVTGSPPVQADGNAQVNTSTYTPVELDERTEVILFVVAI